MCQHTLHSAHVLTIDRKKEKEEKGDERFRELILWERTVFKKPVRGRSYTSRLKTQQADARSKKQKCFGITSWLFINCDIFFNINIFIQQSFPIGQ